MAPTICSEKKRQTHIIASTNIRRQRQGPHQLNSALSNIVNFVVAKGSVNPRISASLRIQNHNRTKINFSSPTVNNHNTNIDAGFGCNHLTATSHRHKQFSFMSDNAVTSSTYSDTENSFDLRLAHEILSSDSTATYDSNKTNLSNAISQLHSSLSDATSLSSHTTKVSSPTPQCQERIFQRFSSVVKANGVNGRGSGSDDYDDDDEDVDYYETDSSIHEINSNKQTNERHSGNIRKHYTSCKDESENVTELNSEVSSAGSDTDMDTENSDSMTSLNTEKSAKLKTVNHRLLRGKFLPKQQANNNKNRCNTDGLLSIAIKTIKLVKRNQLLQQRLTQLQLETSEFIQSVMANPENQHFRENIKPKVHKVEDA